MHKEPASGNARNQAVSIALVSILLTVYFAPFSQIEIANGTSYEKTSESRNSDPFIWGVNGSNDTGWIDLVALGADPENGTMAYGDLPLNFAPGAQISNLTFEVSVNGSAGYWANQPQMTILNTQTQILDWSGLGDFGRQNEFSDNPPSLVDSVLDASLKPNSISDASWDIPTGIEITDLVMEVLRPVDPKLSLLPMNVTIHDSAINPYDGRLYLLVDDDILQLDYNSNKQIIDISVGIAARSLYIDTNRELVLIGDAFGQLSSISLTDSSQSSPFPSDVNSSNDDPIIDITVDQYGVIWAVSDCSAHYLMQTNNAWGTIEFCLGQENETPLEIMAIGRSLIIATENNGVHLIEYNQSVDGSEINVISNNIWDSSNSLSSNNIADIELVNGILLIATSDSGIDRFDYNSDTWLSSWTSNNWLTSDDVIGLSYSPGWLHILGDQSVQAYDTNALIFRSEIQLIDIGLYESGHSISPWPSGLPRSPASTIALVSDSSGTIGRVLEDGADGSFKVVSSPSIESPETVSFVDNQGWNDVWIASGSEINILDTSGSIWLDPIDISEFVSDPGSITEIIQDSDGWVWVGTTESGAHRFSQSDGQYIGSIQGLSSNHVSSMSFDHGSGILVIGHQQSGISLYSTSSNTVEYIFTESNGLDSNQIRDIATRYGVAYAASEGGGVLRIDLYGKAVLGSWQSLGIDGVESAPVAVDGDRVFFGLKGLGILVINRITGDIMDIWTPDDPNGIPDADINTLSMDYFGGLLVGSEVQNTGAGSNGGLARWDGTSWELLPTSIPGRNNDPFEFYDVSSDDEGIYAGTNRGACKWDWADPNTPQSSITLDRCWSYQWQGDGLPSQFVISVDPIGTNLLYAGTFEGAAVINTLNGTIVDVWTAGDETERARVHKFGDIVYLGFENSGIARFNLSSSEWLQSWDGSQGVIDDDDVTALAPGQSQGTMWAGGDFGLTLIDLNNQTPLISWQLGNNQDGPTLPFYPPHEILIIDGIMYYSPTLNGAWNTRDEIHRINLSNNSSLATIDVGDRLGYNGLIHGMDQIGDEIWIGASGTWGWGGGQLGTVLRWNTVSENWTDDLSTIGDVGRVNARYLGDCFPINASCELWVAYGDNILRRYSAQNMILLGQWDDVDGRIRGMVEFNGEFLFASMNGILRWDPQTEIWLPPWLPDDGLPTESELDFYSLSVIDGDLWTSSGDRNDGLIMRLSGNNGNWTTWQVDTADIPDGYGADIALCNDIVHIAVGFTPWQWWQTGGGIARFDLADHDGDGVTGEWITPLTEDNSNIADRDVRALACDDANDVLYIGFDTEDVGFDRFSYGSDSFIGTLTPNTHGISPDKVFPGGMMHDGNVLLVSHYDGEGGISRIITSGVTASNGIVIGTGMDACSIVRIPSINSNNSPAYAIGRSGDSSGINRVDRLDITGLIEGGVDELIGLPSGIVHEFTTNGTHVWLTVGSSQFSIYGSIILQGKLLNDTVEWEYGLRSPVETMNDLAFAEGQVWVTTVGQGLWSLDPEQRIAVPTPPSLHYQMDGLVTDGQKMYVGLMGAFGSSAGFQSFNLDDGTWGSGSLIAGLPSNTVTDFVEYGNHILVATHGGIGLWNTSKSDWDDAITTTDGLTSPIINHLLTLPSPISGNGTVLTGGPNGINVLGPQLDYLFSIDRNDGLMGNSVAGLVYADAATTYITDPITGNNTSVYHGESIFISHDGLGSSSRPGVVAWEIDSNRVNGTYNIDMIPSNDVRAVAADDWGVHIATSLQPIVHWNSSTMKMEAGPDSIQLQAWPLIDLTSDGNHVAAISPGKVSVFSASGEHEITAIIEMTSPSSGATSSGKMAIAASDGLHIFQPMANLNEAPSLQLRRAEPLTALFAGNSWDITSTTRPGMETILVSPESPLIIPIDENQAESSDLLLFQAPLTLSSPSAGSWVWARSTSLNYSGTWDLAAYDPSVEQALQSAIFNTAPGSQSSVVNIQLQSPENGKIKVRLSYDWERLEAPTVITNLIDRPNDGGGVLQATWVPAQDPAWFAYRLYLWDSTDNPDWTPSKTDLESLSSSQRVQFWSQTSTMFSLANRNGSEVPISDDRSYRIAISVEYSDGSLGEPMSWEGNVSPTDEIPSPPAWLEVSPVSGGNAGTLSAEWASCNELDPLLTRIWPTKFEISNALALPDSLDFPFSSGNSTILSLDPNTPYWFAAACVDEAGQFDPTNVTVVGPIVTAGGLNDGIAPAPITGTTASDAPNDEGGRLQVTWEPNQEEDCTYHVVYALPATGAVPPTTVEGWPIADTIPDCTTESTIIDSIGNASLENGAVYWVGVVAVDDWGNQNLDNVLVVIATPPSSDLDSFESFAPDLVTGLQAWDHPLDDGTAIDVSWNRTEAFDFSHYTVWVSELPLDDLSLINSSCNSLIECNLVEIYLRQIGNSPRLEVTIDKALYGNNPENLESSNIVPLVPLYVTVTIHDIYGNVGLTNLGESIAIVTPIDNRGDLIPPDRIEAPLLEDRSPDDGDGFFVEYSLSEANDIAEYHIFSVSGSPFVSAEGLTPSLIVDRSSTNRVLLESLSDQTKISEDTPVWVAVVPVDSSGNSWLDNLKTSMIVPINENILDPGSHLPEVSGIITYWDESGTKVEVIWDEIDHPEISSFSIYASSIRFSDIREAILVDSGVIGSNTSFSSIGPTPIQSTSTYWIAVVAFDGNVHRQIVDSIEVRPLSDFSFGGGGSGPGTAGESWFNQLVDGDLNMIIAFISTLMLLIGAVLIFRPGQRISPDIWEVGTLEIEREEALEMEALGDIPEEEQFSRNDSSEQFLSIESENDIFNQPQDNQIFSDSASVPTNVLEELTSEASEDIDLDDLNEFADELNSDSEEIDTSFIDEALED